MHIKLNNGRLVEFDGSIEEFKDINAMLKEGETFTPKTALIDEDVDIQVTDELIEAVSGKPAKCHIRQEDVDAKHRLTYFKHSELAMLTTSQAIDKLVHGVEIGIIHQIGRAYQKNNTYRIIYTCKSSDGTLLGYSTSVPDKPASGNILNPGGLFREIEKRLKGKGLIGKCSWMLDNGKLRTIRSARSKSK